MRDFTNIIDSHCHLHYYHDEPKITDTLVKAYDAGVDIILNIATKIDDALLLQPTLETLDKNKSLTTPKILYTTGVHPNEIQNFSIEFMIEKMGNLIHNNQNIIIGIGEIGLDYKAHNSCVIDTEIKTQQQNYFSAQLTLAKKYNLPISLHTRDAEQDTLAILRHTKHFGVAHSFAGSKYFAKSLLDLGFYISFSGIITFKNAQELIEILHYIPKERILVETDAPYLSPVPYRGKQNQPSYIIHTIKFIANVLNISTQSLIETINNNFHNLFAQHS